MATPRPLSPIPSPPESHVQLAAERLDNGVAYTWDYATTRPELRTLYEKSKDLMWNARTLAWETNVDPESEIVSDAFNPIFGTDVWKKLDAKTEVPKLRRH